MWRFSQYITTHPDKRLMKTSVSYHSYRKHILMRIRESGKEFLPFPIPNTVCEGHSRCDRIWRSRDGTFRLLPSGVTSSNSLPNSKSVSMFCIIDCILIFPFVSSNTIIFRGLKLGTRQRPIQLTPTNNTQHLRVQNTTHTTLDTQDWTLLREYLEIQTLHK